MKRLLCFFLTVLMVLSCFGIAIASGEQDFPVETVNINVAQGRTISTTSQSTNLSRINDGAFASDTQGSTIAYGTIESSDSSAYFDIDLGRRYPIDKICIFDYNDSNYTANRGKFTIYASDTANFTDKETVYSVNIEEEDNVVTLPDGTELARGGLLEITLPEEVICRYLRYEGAEGCGYKIVEFQAFADVRGTVVTQGASVTGDPVYTYCTTASGKALTGDKLVDGNTANDYGYFTKGGSSSAKGEFTISLDSPRYIGMITIHGSDYNGVGSVNIAAHTDGRFEIFGDGDSLGKFYPNKHSYAGVTLPYRTVASSAATRENYRGPWGFVTDGDTTYSSIKYQKNTNVSSSAQAVVAINEFRAYEINPYVLDVEIVSDTRIVAKFNDYFLDADSIDNIKITLENGTEISGYTLTLAEDKPDVTIDLPKGFGEGRYKLVIDGVKNEYGVAAASGDYVIFTTGSFEPWEQSFVIQDKLALDEDENALSGVVTTNVNENQRYASFWCMGNDNAVTYNFDIPEPGVYRMSAVLGTGTDTAGGTSTVYLHCSEDIYRRTFSSNADFYEQYDIVFGERLFSKKGIYTLKLQAKAGNTVTLRSIKLEKLTGPTLSFASNTIDMLASENSDKSDGVTNTTDNPYTIGAGEYIEWNVIPVYNGYYDISIGADSLGDVYISGAKLTTPEAVITDAMTFYGETEMFGGETYTVRLENNTESDITLDGMQADYKSDFGNRAVLKSLELQSEDGVRMPYAVSDGYKSYAAATIYKSGVAFDKYKLIIGQYTADNNLVDVGYEIIDVSDMAIRESKVFRKELELEGNGGYVKAFLLEDESLAPLSKAVTCNDVDIFADMVIPEAVRFEKDTTCSTNTDNIYAIYYDSEIGEQTKVFAYLGVPADASEDNPVPAVVLVHGGSAEATRWWVEYWVEKGYAAISMDLYGTNWESDSTTLNGQKRHDFAGLEDPWDFSGDYKNSGMYQNVFNILNAHTLIRNLPEVDETRTGITGVSWGGVTTTIVGGVDDRFKFAVPVYGGGYLDMTKTYIRTTAYKPSFDMSKSMHWDPANFAARAKIPYLFINNDNDFAFSVDTTSHTYGVTQDAYLSIRRGLNHDTSYGAKLEMIYHFAEAVLGDSEIPFVKLSGEKIENGRLIADVSVPVGCDVSNAAVELYYITNGVIPSDAGASWQRIDIDEEGQNITDGGRIDIELPEGATYCYVSLVTKANEYSSESALNTQISTSTKLIEVK